MAESLFDIFGDHVAKQIKNNTRQSTSCAENVGKPGSKVPFKPLELKNNFNGNENITPLLSNKGKANVKSGVKLQEFKKNEGLSTKKSFLSNAGKSIQSTPVRQAFTPRPVNVGTLIYKETENDNDDNLEYDAYEFTKPAYKYDRNCRNVFDYLMETEMKYIQSESPINTPPPMITQFDMEFDTSSHDDLFKGDTILNDLSDMSLPDADFSGIF